MCKCEDCRWYDLETGECAWGNDPAKDNDRVKGCWDYEAH